MPGALIVLVSLIGFQTPSPPPTASEPLPPWPKIVIRAGALVADVGSDVRVDSTGGSSSGTSLDLLDDLGFENQTTSAFVDGIWRISKRNRLQVDYEGIRRSV